MGTEGLTDEQYIQQLRETVEQQRQRIAELEARVMQAETQVSAHRTQARAEGFRAARERAAETAESHPGAGRGAIAPSIRAMEDAGEGPLVIEATPEQRARLAELLPLLREAVTKAGSDFRPINMEEAAERMEAATSAECRWCDQPIRRREGRWHHSRSPLLDATHQPSPRENQG